MNIKIIVYRILQTFIRFFQIIRNRAKNLLRKTPYIFLIGSPEHGNMGDELIALGELHWFHTYYSQMVLKEYTHDWLMNDRQCRVLLSCIKKQDILFLHGGGNVNDLYVNCEKIRRRIIKKCPDNQIILFQQSIHFRNTPQAQAYKNETMRIYNCHKHLTIFTREEKSYAIGKEMFPKLQVELLPDMATCLFTVLKPSAPFERNGILLCTRVDNERYFLKSDWDTLLSRLGVYDVSHTDTHVRHPVKKEKRMQESQNLLDSFAHAKVIVTDRFHGVIFSILSRTPCIALRSCDHKITEGVKWFRTFPGVMYAESLDEIPALIDKAMNLKNLTPPDFGAYFKKMFDIVEKRRLDG